ncbi:unnamed protein product [Prorocentrum cordatum]|uniref:Sushi domain-containing protein n=1 Tax=Prorocentrum cordatum TaxID=2364126 RepID=A0ABN9Y5U3_9DINO|nr:unnamed protein product [Polarella glacialis]
MEVTELEAELPERGYEIEPPGAAGVHVDDGGCLRARYEEPLRGAQRRCALPYLQAHMAELFTGCSKQFFLVEQLQAGDTMLDFPMIAARQGEGGGHPAVAAAGIDVETQRRCGDKMKEFCSGKPREQMPSYVQPHIKATIRAAVSEARSVGVDEKKIREAEGALRQMAASQALEAAVATDDEAAVQKALAEAKGAGVKSAAVEKAETKLRGWEAARAARAAGWAGVRGAARELTAAISSRKEAQLQRALEKAREAGVTPSMIEDGEKVLKQVCAEGAAETELRAALGKRDEGSLQQAIAKAREAGARPVALKEAERVLGRLAAGRELADAIGSEDGALLEAAVPRAREAGVEAAIVERGAEALRRHSFRRALDAAAAAAGADPSLEEGLSQAIEAARAAGVAGAPLEAAELRLHSLAAARELYTGLALSARLALGREASADGQRCPNSAWSGWAYGCTVAEGGQGARCAEGPRIEDGGSCTASAAALACREGRLTPPAACAEGASVGSGGTCTPSCARGYVPDVASCRAPAGVENAGSVPCREGAEIGSGGACAAVCQGVAHAASPSCEQGGSIRAGTNCTAACKAGYVPNVTSLTCNQQELPPFECREKGCTAPTGIENAEDVTCQEGTNILAGGACTAACQAGYAPTAASLTCSHSELRPPSFECYEKRCLAPTSIENAMGESCQEGAEIHSGGTCTAECEEGYTPSVASLECRLGVFTPASFECYEQGCVAPRDIENAEGVTCEEGATIEAAGTCTAACQAGFLPDEASLACSRGELRPPMFVCREKTCAAPASVENAEGVPCQEGAVIDSGGNCTALCQEGYAPDVKSLACSRGELTPASFECVEQGCMAPGDIEDAADAPCEEGATIEAAGTCTAACRAGYVPDVTSLACNHGLLRPPSFECFEAPRAQHNKTALAGRSLSLWEVSIRYDFPFQC